MWLCASKTLFIKNGTGHIWPSGYSLLTSVLCDLRSATVKGCSKLHQYIANFLELLGGTHSFISLHREDERHFPGSGSGPAGKPVFSESVFVYNTSLTRVSGESLPTYFPLTPGLLVTAHLLHIPPELVSGARSWHLGDLEFHLPPSTTLVTW